MGTRSRETPPSTRAGIMKSGRVEFVKSSSVRRSAQTAVSAGHWYLPCSLTRFAYSYVYSIIAFYSMFPTVLDNCIKNKLNTGLQQVVASLTFAYDISISSNKPYLEENDVASHHPCGLGEHSRGRTIRSSEAAVGRADTAGVEWVLCSCSVKVSCSRDMPRQSQQSTVHGGAAD